MQATDLIALAFATFNVLRLVSYFPQIVAVARDRRGAEAISVSCWSIWIGANSSASLYAWVNLGDAIMALMMGFNAICCTTVVTLAVCKRFVRFRRVRSLSVVRIALRSIRAARHSPRPGTQRHQPAVDRQQDARHPA
jgi:hypothetical protein